MQNPLSLEPKWLAIRIPPLMAVLFLATFSGCDTTPMKPAQGGLMAPPKPSMAPPPFPSKPGLTQQPVTGSAANQKPAALDMAKMPIAATPGGLNAATNPAGPLSLPHPPEKLPLPPGNDAGTDKTDGTIALPISKVEQAGQPVDLAVDILASGTNPFLSKLPKPKTVAISTTAGMPEPVPTDPLEGLTLQGILYGKNPLAMIAVSGDENGGATLVRPGDTVGAAKVVAIHPNGIEITNVSGQDRKTLNMPSIIRHGATTDASSAVPSARGNETSSMPDERQHAGSPVLAQGSSSQPPLQNIKKIVEKMAKDGADPKLME